MQKRGEPDFLRSVKGGSQRVFEHVVVVEVAPLRHFSALGEFGENNV